MAAISRRRKLLITTSLKRGSATWYRDLRREPEATAVKYQDCGVVADGDLVSWRPTADIPAFIGVLFRIMGLLR